MCVFPAASLPSLKNHVIGAIFHMLFADYRPDPPHQEVIFMLAKTLARDIPPTFSVCHRLIASMSNSKEPPVGTTAREPEKTGVRFDLGCGNGTCLTLPEETGLGTMSKCRSLEGKTCLVTSMPIKGHHLPNIAPTIQIPPAH